MSSETAGWGVFFDRDGTLTREVGYVNHPSRLELLPGAAEAIRLLNNAGIPAILATNQAGVARGYFTEGLVGVVLERLEELLRNLGARLDALYYCPHHPSVGAPPYRLDCGCRKPKPGMLLKGAEAFGLDLAQSFVVGDKISDVEFAHGAGASGVMVLTGYGLGEQAYQRESWKEQPDFLAPDVLAAVDWILAKRKVGG